MKKILLISIYDTHGVGIKSIFYQLKHRWETHLIFFCEYDGLKTKEPTEKEYDLLIEKIKEINPSIIGFSTMSSVSNFCIEIIKKIRKILNPFIIIGGSHSIAKPEECIKYADAVSIWESDKSIIQLCDKYFKGEDYTKTKNFWIKKDGKIFKNDYELIEDLDSLRKVDLDNKNVYYILDNELSNGWRMLKGYYFISTGRGCPFRCSFCIWSTLHKTALDKTNYLRRRSVENVINEMKLAKERFDIKMFYLSDATFIKRNDEVDWFKDFCEEYEKEIDKPIWIAQSLSPLNDENLSLLKPIMKGESRLNVGIQSGCESFRKEIYDKYLPNSIIAEKIKKIREYGITAKYDLILSNPLETDEDLKEGINFLITLRPIRLRLFRLTNCPNTKLTNMLIKRGYIKKESDTSVYYGQRISVEEQLFKTKKERYWYFTYSLISIRYIPDFFIKFCINDFFILRPYILSNFFDLFILPMYKILIKIKTKLPHLSSIQEV